MPDHPDRTVPLSVSVILALGIVSFSFSPILVRYGSDAPSLAVATLRTLMAVGLLLPFLRTRHLVAYRHLRGRDWLGILAAGVLLGLHFFLFFESLYNTTVASTTIIVALSPIFMAGIGYVFLGERLRPAVLVGIAIATVGGVLIGWGDAGGGQAPNPGWGNLLAVGASLTVSVYLIIGRVARQGMDWLTYVLPLYTVAALTLLAIALATGVPLAGYPVRIYGISLAMAIGPQLLGHGSFNLAVKYITAAMLGLFALTEPIGASLLAFALFEERPAPLAILGMALALGAVALSLSPSLFRKPRGG